jgi:uncharacterized protein (TIGR03435 family)
MRRHRISLLILATLLFATRLYAIAPPASGHPSFDVVSIKPANPDADGRFQLRFTPDGFSARKCSLKTLIIVAFHLKDARLLENLPPGKEALYDIEAKVAEADVPGFRQLSDPDKQLMLQGLLAERFQLKYHMISKELPVYALVLDKHGAKLADAKPNAAGKIERSMRVTGRYTVAVTGSSTGDIFQLLSELSGRYVVDRTGLTGRYDFTLRCAPDPSVDPREDVEWDGPVIFTALREQLGLALEPSTAMLDAVVIDHVETPTPN